MKKMYLIVLTLLVGCVTTNIKDGEELKYNEGYLVFSIEANDLDWELSLYRKKNLESIFGKAEALFNFTSEKKTFIIKLENGLYTLKYLYNKPYAFELDNYFFEIKPGVINYIGGLKINVTNNDPYFPKFNYLYENKEDEARKTIIHSHPVIYNKYEFSNKSLIEPTIKLEPYQWM